MAHAHQMIDNNHMACDDRNLGLLGATDGVPLFDDQHRGAWPFIQRVAMTDQLSMNVANAHLHLLSSNEYWTLDKEVNRSRHSSTTNCVGLCPIFPTTFPRPTAFVGPCVARKA